MPGEDRLQVVVDTWLAAADDGRLLPVAEVCLTCPELISEAERQINVLRQFHELAHPAGPRPARADTLPNVTARDSAADAVPARTTVPGMKIGRYEILGEIGRGGMGVVYKARDVQLNRFVAVKMILAGSYADELAKARFQREARMVARLQHPNIVQLFEIGEQLGESFICLELIEGGSLADKLATTPLTPRDAAGFIETLARAMHVAHQQGIVHRDLKPANVLLTLDGTPKITDFGLAKNVQTESIHSRSGSVMGTPSYMAPEQAAGHIGKIGPLSDVYSLGAILYEALTGRPPFKAATPLETLMQVMTVDPPPPSRLQPNLPRDLEVICLKCLQKEPARRYGSAAELADDLNRWLDQKTIKARPAGLSERLLKWSKRRPAAAALIGVSALAVVCLATAGAFVIQSKLKALQESREQIDRLIVNARGQVVEKKWETAQMSLTEAGKLAGQDAAWADRLTEIKRLQEEVDQNLTAEQARKTAVVKLKEFAQLRDEAQFHASQSFGEDVPALTRTEEAARKALKKIGGSNADNGAISLDPALNEKEREDIRTDCSQLLLILAEATAQPRPRQNPKQQSDAADAAVQLLDLAAGNNEAIKGYQSYHVRRARYLEQGGKKVQAADERAEASRRKPQAALDYFLVGEELYKQEDLEEAARHFESALDLKNDFWTRYFLALCHVRMSRPAEARTGLTVCLEQRPDFIWVYLMRGYASGLLNEFEAAERDYAAAERLLQGDEEAEYALYANLGVLRIRSANLAADRYRTPLGVLVAGAPVGPLHALPGLVAPPETPDMKEAVADLRRAIEKRPKRYEAHASLAEAYQSQRKLKEALEQYNEAIKWEEKLPSLYRLRARLYLELQNWDKALEDFAQAIRLDNSQPQVQARDHTERGRILNMRKQYREAAREFEEAIRLWPTSAAAHFRLADALFRLQQQEPNARSILDETVSAFGLLAPFNVVPILLKDQRDLDEEIVRSLDAYLKKGGKPSAEVYRMRGIVQERLRRFTEAIDSYTAAIVLQSEDASALAARGRLHLATHSPNLAVADFDRLLTVDSASGDAFSGRGLARARLGLVSEAVKDAETAVGLLPEKSKNKARTYYDAARTYSLVVGRLDQESSRFSRSELERRRDYQDRALELLGKALGEIPGSEQAPFWRNRVMLDPSLAAIRRSPNFGRMSLSYPLR
jgi:tetratricopeptide (TPR) repeat protein